MILSDWPKKIRSGDTLQFKVRLDGFSSSTDTLSFYLASASENYSFTATDSTGEFLISVPATETANWQRGEYTLNAVVTSIEGVVTTVKDYPVEITPNLRFGNADPRTHVKRSLDAINAVLEKRAGHDVQEYEIDNRRLIRMPVTELMRLKSHFQMLYAQECGLPTSIIRRFK